MIYKKKKKSYREVVYNLEREEIEQNDWSGPRPRLERK